MKEPFSCAEGAGRRKSAAAEVGQALHGRVQQSGARARPRGGPRAAARGHLVAEGGSGRAALPEPRASLAGGEEQRRCSPGFPSCSARPASLRSLLTPLPFGARDEACERNDNEERKFSSCCGVCPRSERDSSEQAARTL